ELLIQAGQISSKVSQTTYDGFVVATNGTLTSYGSRITTAESNIIQNADNIALKVNQTDYNTLAGRVTTAEGSITTQAGQIALKASQSSLDTLTGRVTSAESNIIQNADNILLKVSTTDYNGDTIMSKINLTSGSAKIQ